VSLISFQFIRRGPRASPDAPSRRCRKSRCFRESGEHRVDVNGVVVARVGVTKIGLLFGDWKRDEAAGGASRPSNP